MPGVAGRKPIHLLEPDQRKKVVELKGMHIDIGAADREEAEALVRVGDPVVIAAEPVRSPASGSSRGRWTTASAPTSRWRPAPLRRGQRPRRLLRRDCRRAGGDRPLRRPHRRLRGPAGPRRRRRRHPRHRRPGVDEKEIGSHPLGSGPAIGRGSTLSPKVFELLVEAAEEEGIEHTISASGRGTSTDADALQISRSGIPTGLVSIPLRYMHSPVEMVDLATSRRR